MNWELEQQVSLNDFGRRLMADKLNQQEEYAVGVSLCGWLVKRFNDARTAVLVECHTEFGSVSRWLPVKGLATEEDLAKDAARFERKLEAMDRGLDYNSTLKAFLKDNGGRNYGARHVKTATLIDAIRELGKEPPARV